LGRHLDLPLPFAVRNGVHGAPELKLIAPAEPGPVSLPPALMAIADVQGRPDAALALCASVRQGRELTGRLHALNRQRGTQGETGGVFRVTKAFTAMGSCFEAHQLVDASILGPGLLERYWKGRAIEPSQGAVA
jgi:hypothetical protein